METSQRVSEFQLQFSSAATSLSEDNLDQLLAFYSPEARFIDPFAELVGQAPIRASYASMFKHLHGARFVCQDWANAIDSGASPKMMMTWLFLFKARPSSQETCIKGASWLELNPDTLLIDLHQDYWDASALLAAFPGLGWLIRKVKSRIANAGHVIEKS